jgi:twinkle protein
MHGEGWSAGEACPIPAPECGSSDAFKRHADGHGHCFSCGHHVNAAGDSAPAAARPAGKGGFPLAGEVQVLTKRQLSEETCRKWGYHVGTLSGRPVQIANYMRDGAVVAQKVRFPDKDFTFLGEPKAPASTGCTSGATAERWWSSPRARSTRSP